MGQWELPQRRPLAERGVEPHTGCYILSCPFPSGERALGWRASNQCECESRSAKLCTYVRVLPSLNDSGQRPPTQSCQNSIYLFILFSDNLVSINVTHTGMFSSINQHQNIVPSLLCVQAGISLCLAERAPGAWQWNFPWGNTLLHSLPKLSIASASTFSVTNENNKLSCRGTCNMCLLLWKNLDRGLKESEIEYCLGYLLENNVSLSKGTQDCWIYLNLVMGFFWWKQKCNKTT